MPTATLLHVALAFGIGAAAGGGLVGAFSSRGKKDEPNVPILDVSPNGGAGVTTSVAHLLVPALKYGHPGPVSDVLTRKSYIAAYDRRLRHPAWTAEHLTLAKLARPKFDPTANPELAVSRQKSTFFEDLSLPEMFRAKMSDYYGSGYDRGHMVPAADCKQSQEALNETFALSNIAPQVGPGFNRHYWAYLEEWCRRLTDKFSDVYVFTIPLYLPKLEADGKWRVTHEMIGNPPNVAVPTHFAKVVLTSKPTSPLTPNTLEISTGAFVLPNSTIKDETPLTQFVVPVDQVERYAGLTLFSDALKASSRHICESTKCEVIIRRFDDAIQNSEKRPKPQRRNSSPL